MRLTKEEIFNIADEKLRAVITDAYSELDRMGEALRSLSYPPDDTIDPSDLIQRSIQIARQALEGKP